MVEVDDNGQEQEKARDNLDYWIKLELVL